VSVWSGIEPHLIAIAFETFKEKTVCDRAEFVMNIQELLLYRNDCRKEMLRSEAHYQCGHCQSTNVSVVDGDGMYLMTLEQYYAT